MQSFFSDALGRTYEYRAWFSDRVRIVLMAHGTSAGDLRARLSGDSGDYKLVAHTNAQIKQVQIDMDKAEIGVR